MSAKKAKITKAPAKKPGKTKLPCGKPPLGPIAEKEKLPAPSAPIFRPKGTTTTAAGGIPATLAKGGWEIARSTPSAPPVVVAQVVADDAPTGGLLEGWKFYDTLTGLPLPAPLGPDAYRFDRRGFVNFVPELMRTSVSTQVTDTTAPSAGPSTPVLQHGAAYEIRFDDGTYDLLVVDANGVENWIHLSGHAHPVEMPFTLRTLKFPVNTLDEYLEVFRAVGS